MSNDAPRQQDIYSEPAWNAAAAAGIDMSLIEESLRKTPEQRIYEHGCALATLEALEKARENNV